MLATYILVASASFGGHATYYTLQSNGWKSFSVLTGLPPLDCNLVRVDPKNKVIVLKAEWERFLGEYGLRSGTERDGATSKLKCGGGTLTLHHPLETKIAHQMKCGAFVSGVGTVPKGGYAPKGVSNIKKCEEPPRLNRRTYTAAAILWKPHRKPYWIIRWISLLWRRQRQSEIGFFRKNDPNTSIRS
ncbi:hypothetical protein ACHAXR_002440 [Thalassiosira sp. AJA248-18]